MEEERTHISNFEEAKARDVIPHVDFDSNTYTYKGSAMGTYYCRRRVRGWALRPTPTTTRPPETIGPGNQGREVIGEHAFVEHWNIHVTLTHTRACSPRISHAHRLGPFAPLPENTAVCIVCRDWRCLGACGDRKKTNLATTACDRFLSA